MKNFIRTSILLIITGILCIFWIPLFSIYYIDEQQFLIDSANKLIDSANAYVTMGDYEKSLALIERSHQLRKKVFRDSSHYLIKSYINMAFANTLVYKYDRALQYLHEAEKMSKRSGTERREELGTIYSYYGRIYKDLGDYLHAEQYLRRAEEYLLESKLNNLTKLVFHYALYAEVETLLENTDSSLLYYQKSYRIIQKLSGNEALLIDYLMGSAMAYSKAGNYEKSIHLQHSALKIARRDSADFALRLGILYSNLGWNYLEINDLNQSELALRNALKIYKYLGIKGVYLAELYENFGRLYNNKGDLRHSLSFYQKALKLTAPVIPDESMGNPELAQIEAALPALRILKSKSNCLRGLYVKEKKIEHLDQAINTSLLAIELVEHMRNSYQSYESKLQTLEHEYEIFDIALNLLHTAYQNTGDYKYGRLTFTVSEKSKSSILLSVLNELDARQFGEIPDSLLEKERNLSKSIALYKEYLYEEKQSNNPSAAKITTWERYLFDAQREYNQLILYFEDHYPNYFNLKYDYSVTDIRELQKNLPPRTSLIEYSISDSVLLTFIITKNNYHMLTQNIGKEFYDQLNNYLKKFHQFDFSKQSLADFTDFCWTSQSLYNILIAPAYKYISGNSLIIVPDGILSYLPFETLINEIPDGIPTNQYRNLKYLIHEFAVSYSYSATLYDQVNKKHKAFADNKLLAFAPEYSNKSNEQISENSFYTRQNYRKDLYPIPGVIEEVETIHNLISGDLFIGEDATEKNFKDTARYYDILHLAMHTVIDNNNPLYSKLIFTLNNDSSQDGLLNTYEVFNLILNARMVVLSACSTGSGEFNNGEGIISLARGFVYAGSPSIVMTMWEVEDKSGSELMKYFYKNLTKGQSKSKAMQNAKLQCIKEARPENTHPFFWSSFVVMGNSHPLFPGKSTTIAVCIAGCLIFLYLVWIIIRKTRAVRKYKV